MTAPLGPVRVLIASFLEPDLLERIRAVDPRLEVTYRGDLLGQPRYPADHSAPMGRTAAQDAEWDTLVARAEVMFDVFRPRSDRLAERAPRLRWIQFSSSGVASFVQGSGLGATDVVVTNAAGIHARPLAEFVLFAMLYFAKRMPRVLADQRAHHWQRFALDTLPGKTLGIVGFGRVGKEVAGLARANGVRVVTIRRGAAGSSEGAREAGGPSAHDAAPVPPAHGGASAAGQPPLVVCPPEGLAALLAESDYVALTLPLTGETAGLIGEAQLGLMKPGAVLINVARGQVVDEPALVRALQGGRLGGAALDVFTVEPLPSDSPLWDMPNVLVTPHSMSTALDENERLIDLFADNLRRYLDDRPLLNVFDRQRGY